MGNAPPPKAPLSELDVTLINMRMAAKRLEYYSRWAEKENKQELESVR